MSWITWGKKSERKEYAETMNEAADLEGEVRRLEEELVEAQS